MSAVSVNIPELAGISASESPAAIPAPEKAPNELNGYKESMSKHEAVEKCLDPISDNVRNQVWMRPELSAFSNFEYVYAIYPIAISLFSGVKTVKKSAPQDHSL